MERLASAKSASVWPYQSAWAKKSLCCGPNLLLSKAWSSLGMRSWWPRLMGTCSMMPLSRFEKMGEADELMITHVSSHNYLSCPIIVLPIHLHSHANQHVNSNCISSIYFLLFWHGLRLGVMAVAAHQGEMRPR